MSTRRREGMQDTYIGVDEAEAEVVNLRRKEVMVVKMRGRICDGATKNIGRVLTRGLRKSLGASRTRRLILGKCEQVLKTPPNLASPRVTD